MTAETSTILSVDRSSDVPGDAGETYHALMLDARQRQSLVAVRSLGRQGLAVAGLDTSNHVPALTSSV